MWTEDKFVAQVASEKAEREKKAVDKVQRQLQCEKKKAAADDVWKGMVDAHKVEVDAWTAECVHSHMLKVKVKDLPKKPKTVVIIESDPSSDDDDNNE